MGNSKQPRAYHELREIIERQGGTMCYRRPGYRHGAWEISLDGKTTIVESTGSRSFPQLDRLYQPDPALSNPKTWDDCCGPLVDDAEEQLLSLVKSSLFSKVAARSLVRPQAQRLGQRGTAMTLEWAGPYSWPGFEKQNNLPSVPKHSGIYLMTSNYGEGYAIYAAGLTRRPISTRLREHTRKYMTGNYTILDLEALHKGVRKELWHGWGWTPKKREMFDRRKEAILGSARRQLKGFRIFVANVDPGPRILERIEAAIMNALYQQLPPLCGIPDKGMMLAGRSESESPLTIMNSCTARLHGLPTTISV